MRDIERRYHIKPRGLLMRNAEGKLKPATDDRDIADIWAEQKRIQLADAIAADNAKRLKKQRRKERRLFGAVRTAENGAETKEIEIKISMPHVDLRALWRRIRRLPVPRLSKKQWGLIGSAALLFLLVVGTRSIYDKPDGPTHISKKGVSGAAVPVGGAQPAYQTVLPAGKTIDQLGGWGRVSPPDKDPVFGYSDSLRGVHIVVSEQPMPHNLAGDLTSQLQQIAKQFNTTKKMQTDLGAPVFQSVAASGAQSLITTKNDLLIFLRSSARIDDTAWNDYIDSLK